MASKKTKQPRKKKDTPRRIEWVMPSVFSQYRLQHAVFVEKDGKMSDLNGRPAACGHLPRSQCWFIKLDEPRCGDCLHALAKAGIAVKEEVF